MSGFDETHPRGRKPASDGDTRTGVAVLNERVDQHHIRLASHDQDIDDLCDRMTKLEVLRASGVKVSWFVATAVVAIVTSACGVLFSKLLK